MSDSALQPEVATAFRSALKLLESEGYRIHEVDMPEVDYLLETYYILTTAEASSNLSRYDGFRYGYGEGARVAKKLDESYRNTRSAGFGEEVKRRIFLGTFVLSASYYDAYYTKAQKARAKIRNKTVELLKKHDLILSPVSPTTAFEMGSRIDDPIQMYLADQYTVHASVCGLPAISIPIGVDTSGLPIGLQATANYFEDEKLLDFAKYLGNL